MADNVTEIWRKIKPLAVKELTGLNAASTTSTSTGGGTTDTSAFLRSDGTRPLTGNLAVGTGVTIDGVQLGTLQVAYNAHVANANGHHDMVTVTDTTTIDFTLSGQALTASVIPGGIDHGALADLGADDHTQYLTTGRHDLTSRHPGTSVIPTATAVGLTVASVTGAGSGSNLALANHVHGITTSSNPGAAASILATTAAGLLQLVGLGIGAAPTANNVTLADGGYFQWSDVALVRGGANVLGLANGDAFRSSDFASGVSGWGISADGSAEFSNIRARGELAASVFKIGEITATAGTLGVFKSAGVIYQDVTSTASPTTFYLKIKNTDAGASLFAVGDVLRVKSWNGTILIDNWITTDFAVNYGSYTSYKATVVSGTPGSLMVGMAVEDYGPSGTGYITLSTDGTIGSSANITIATHAGSPWSAQTIMARLGNLNNSYGQSTDVYGVGLGTYGVASKSSVVVLDTGISLYVNTTERIGLTSAGVLTIKDSAGNAVLTFDASSGAEITKKLTMPGANSAIAIGTTPPTSASAGTGIWIDKTGLYGLAGDARQVVISATTGALAVGNPAPTSASSGTGLYMDKTGLYGLLSNTVQAKFDAATGAITAGAGVVTIDVNGVSFTQGSGSANKIKWFTGASNNSSIYAVASGPSSIYQTLSINAIDTHLKIVQDDYGNHVKVLNDTVEIARFGEKNQVDHLNVCAISNTTPYNAAQGEIKTSGTIYAGGDVYIGGDTRLYRYAADVLRTPDSLTVDGTLTATTGSITTLTATNISFSPTMTLTQAQSTTLSADVKTAYYLASSMTNMAAATPYPTSLVYYGLFKTTSAATCDVKYKLSAFNMSSLYVACAWNNAKDGTTRTFTIYYSLDNYATKTSLTSGTGVSKSLNGTITFPNGYCGSVIIYFEVTSAPNADAYPSFTLQTVTFKPTASWCAFIPA